MSQAANAVKTKQMLTSGERPAVCTEIDVPNLLYNEHLGDLADYTTGCNALEVSSCGCYVAAAVMTSFMPTDSRPHYKHAVVIYFADSSTQQFTELRQIAVASCTDIAWAASPCLSVHQLSNLNKIQLCAESPPRCIGSPYPPAFVIDAHTGAVVHQLESESISAVRTTLTAHAQSITGTVFHWSPCGRFLLRYFSHGANKQLGRLLVLDLHNGKVMIEASYSMDATWPASTLAAVWHPVSTGLVASSSMCSIEAAPLAAVGLTVCSLSEGCQLLDRGPAAFSADSRFLITRWLQPGEAEGHASSFMICAQASGPQVLSYVMHYLIADAHDFWWASGTSLLIRPTATSTHSSVFDVSIGTETCHMSHTFQALVACPLEGMVSAIDVRTCTGSEWPHRILDLHTSKKGWVDLWMVRAAIGPLAWSPTGCSYVYSCQDYPADTRDFRSARRGGLIRYANFVWRRNSQQRQHPWTSGQEG